MKFVYQIIANTVGLWVATLLLPGLFVPETASTSENILTYLSIGLILTLLNSIVRPVIKFLSFPLYILTLGLFGLVVNAIIIGLTGWISTQLTWGLHVSGFWAALFGGLIVSIIASAVTALISSKD
ncbi:hypothetical protein BK816_00545 [Boudabousia tangfeifanii]|uniref:Phage holin family protein n=1 Tax=Boudabousia tangfeifanii TaxID=1912795 RepID=A0A1D9MI27_9ACTO|nr:phage holin family protein [Boudabousia tangfeifanii]AOZ71965.1 hypothetical protein BK816_00545 [Boudabousia tangfeifanii]